MMRQLTSAWGPAIAVAAAALACTSLFCEAAEDCWQERGPGLNYGEHKLVEANPLNFPNFWEPDTRLSACPLVHEQIHVDGVARNPYAARWIGSIYIRYPGTIEFKLTTNAGSRSRVRIGTSGWQSQQEVAFEVDEGSHRFVVDYVHDQGNSIVKLEKTGGPDFFFFRPDHGRPPCGCEKLQKGAMPDDWLMCQKWESSATCWPPVRQNADEEWDCEGGDREFFLCSGPMEVPECISLGCTQDRYRNGAGPWDVYNSVHQGPWCQPCKINGGECRQPCLSCDLSICQDVDVAGGARARCKRQSQWECCMKPLLEEQCDHLLSGGSPTAAFFDCAFKPEYKDKCCANAALADWDCEDLPTLDVSSCGDETCRQEKRQEFCTSFRSGMTGTELTEHLMAQVLAICDEVAPVPLF